MDVQAKTMAKESNSSSLGSGPLRQRDWALILSTVIGVGLVFVLAYAAQHPWPAPFLSIASAGILIAGASLLMGALVGFLFGVPRSLQQQYRPDGASKDNADKAEIPSSSNRYEPNTNLEQISDWLTKILVGVGLTQLAKIPGKLELLGRFLGPAIGGAPGADLSSADRFALVLVLFFLTTGFLFGYLWTRIFLGSLLTRADFDKAIEYVKAAHDEKVQEDARALSLVHRYLLTPINPDENEPQVSVDELKQAIKEASPSGKVQIFYVAETVRTQNWEKDKELIAKTIPIFEALAESDIEHKYHRNFAQLGYALKDKPQPDWAAAEKALTAAIEIRGPWQQNGWLFYEFNRAVCRIQLDSDFGLQQPTSKNLRSAIVEDLKALRSDSYMARLLARPPVSAWLKLNPEAAAELGAAKTP